MQRIIKNAARLFACFAIIVCMMMLVSVTAFAADEDAPADAAETVADCAPAAEVSVSAQEVEVAEPAAMEEGSEASPAEEASELTPADEISEPAGEEEELSSVEEESALTEGSVSPDETLVEGETAEQSEIRDSAEPVTAPEDAEQPELKDDSIVVTPTAQFTAVDGHTETIEVGESVDLKELISRLGYEGEIESVSSSNPQAFEVVEGQLLVKETFQDETLTVVINGLEIVIPVHDPETIEVENEKELYEAFESQDQYSDIVIKIKDSIEVNNGTLTVREGKTVTLDLGVYSLVGKEGSQGSVINVKGTFTLKGSAVDESEYGSISHGNADKGGGVYVTAGGRFTMESGVIEDCKAQYGAGVYNAGSFTMKGGRIIDNEAAVNGGGLYNAGSFIMSGGEISGNEASSGGGVYNESSFTMSAGEISGNEASSGGGVYQSGDMTVSGSGNIVLNTGKSGDDNIYLPKGKTVAIGGTLRSDALFGILSEEKPHYDPEGTAVPVKVVTNAQNESVVDSFSSDEENCEIVFNAAGYLQLEIVGEAVAQLDDGSKYLYVQDAINAANDTYKTVTMLADSTECISIAAGKEVTLDLSGHTLSGTLNGSVITVTGTFTLTDSSEEKTGTVTGGDAKYGGGVIVRADGSFTMNGGSITDNKAAESGAGVYNEGSFALTGGSITRNEAAKSGGGVYNAGSFAMTGGEITDNRATISGGGVYNVSRFSFSGGKIEKNDAKDGGGVYNAGNFTMSSGEITDNNASSSGGGVYQGGSMTVSGTGNVSGNTVRSDSDASNNNVFLPKDHVLSIGETGFGAVEFGITTEVKLKSGSDKVRITGGGKCEAGYTQFFKSDDSAYSVVFDNSIKDLFLQAGAPIGGVAMLHDGSGAGTIYESLQTAINEASGSNRYITLLDDTVENVTVEKEKDVLLDLNGHKLKGGKDGGSVITVRGTLTLSDGSADKTGIITGGSADIGGGVNIIAGGKFTMDSGKISGNRAKNGGGVYVAEADAVGGLPTAVMVMNGGEISANTATSVGGGIYADGDTAINGGQIINNIGGGVFFSGGKLTLSGSALVRYNKECTTDMDAAADENIVLGKSDSYDCYNVFNIGTLDESAKFGISVNGSFPKGDFVQISVSAKESDTAHFVSDNDYYSVEFNKGGYLQLRAFDAVAELDDGRRFDSVQAAIDAANEKYHEVTLLRDCVNDERLGKDYRENIIIKGKTVTLDLNGYTLQGKGNDSVITVENEGNEVGDFTLDSSTSGGVIKGGTGKKKFTATHGGGVYVDAGAMFELKNGTIIGNKADAGGGVYLAKGAYMTIEGGAIEENTALSGSGLGGGIYGFDITVIMNGGQITGNKAINGGGILLIGESDFIMFDGSISDNKANSYGGGIDAAGDVIIKLRGGKISGNRAANGAGIYGHTGSSINIFAGEISNNIAGQSGGGVYSESTKGFLMTGGIITDNSAAKAGGGIYAKVFTLDGGEISKNTARAEDKVNTCGGGGVFIKSEGRFEMNGGTITGNISKIFGGGVYIGVAGSFDMNYGTISDNEAGQSGGGCYTDGMFTMKGGEISRNKALGYNGGGLYINGLLGGKAKMIGGTISGNKAQNGGGVYIYAGEFGMTGGEISGNEARGDGGGVYIEEEYVVKSTHYHSLFDMGGGTISGNKAEGNGGGVYDACIFQLHGRAEITGNSAGSNGGGVYLSKNKKGKTSEMTVGEEPRVIGNSLISGKLNNVYLPGVQNGGEHFIMRIRIKDLTDGAYIGITTQLKPNEKIPVGFSTDKTGKSEYVRYFNSDDPAYHVAYLAEGKVAEYEPKAYQVMVLAKGGPTDAVAQLNDGTLYPSVQAAVEAANKQYYSIKMLKDSKENVVVDGKTVTLNLDGHTLSGGNTYRSVITLSGGAGLTLNDSLESTGMITGGNASVGGGVSVTEGSSFHMVGGKITDCTAQRGGGVYVDKDSSFAFSGGEISGNKAEFARTEDGSGGGVYNAGKFEIYGMRNKIENNTADYGGGVYNSSTGTLEIRSYVDDDPSEISGNKATKQGGGVYNEGSFNFHGGKISGNSVTGSCASGKDIGGGGIYQNGEMTVYFSDDVFLTVDGNTEAVTDSANNIYLPQDRVVKVKFYDEKISKISNLGITTQKDPYFDDEPKIPFAEAETAEEAAKALIHFKSDGGFKKIREDETLYLIASFKVEYFDGESHYGDGSSSDGTRYTFDPAMPDSLKESDVELVWTDNVTYKLPAGVTYTIVDGKLVLRPYQSLADGAVVFADAGSYEFRAIVKGVVSDSFVTFKVLPREVTVKANDNFKYAGNNDPVLTATVTGTLKGEEVTIHYELSRDAGEEVGTYAIIPTGDELQGNGNYKVSFVNGTFEIIKQGQLIVIGYDYDADYDGEEHGAAAWTSITDADVIVSYSTDDGETWQLSIPKIKDVGEIFVTVKAEKGSKGQHDYLKDEDYYILKVTPKEITVVWTVDDYTYDGEEHAPTAEAVGVVEGEDVSVSVEGSGIDAGNYTAKAVLGGEDIKNYIFAKDVPPEHEFTIKPKEITVKWSDDEFTYDGEEHAPTAVAEGVLDKDKDKVSVTVEGSGIDAGDYTADAAGLQGDAASNYAFASVAELTHEFAINPRAVTVTADSKSKVVGEEDPELTATVKGTLGDDTVEFKLTRESGEGVGVYDIIPYGVELQGNYEVSFELGSFVITDSNVLTVTGTDYDGVYDAGEHGVAATANKEGSEIFYSIDGGETWTEEFPTIVNAGSILVIVRAENGNEIAMANYTLSVSPKTVTVTAVDAGKEFGDEDPELKAEVEGTLGDDTVEYTLWREAGEAVGTYTIYPAGDEIQGNYELSFISGEFEIRSTEKFKVAGIDHDDEYDGFEHGEAAIASITEGTTISYSTDGGEHWTTEFPTITDAGEIIVMVKAENPDYTTATDTYTLTVVPKEIDLIWSGDDFEYDLDTHQPTAEAEPWSIIVGDTVNISVFGEGTAIGTYTAIARIDNDNYVISSDTEEFVFTVTSVWDHLQDALAGNDVTSPSFHIEENAPGERTIVLDKDIVTLPGDTCEHTIYVSTEAGIDLIGKAIKSSSPSEDKAPMFIISRRGSLTILDSEGGGVISGSGSTGSIIENEGNLTVENGKLTGGNADKGGGVNNSGTFTMTGGEISGNNAKVGGGVYSSGKFIMNGSPLISGNTSEEEDSNVYLAKGKKIDITGKFTDGASIGIREESISADGFTRGYSDFNTADPAEFFTSDDIRYSVILLANGEAALFRPGQNTSEEAHIRYVFEKAAYRFLVRSGSFEAKLVFTGYGAPADEEELKFLVLKVDGVEISPDNYTLTLEKNGDIIIEFTAEYMDSLAKGEHTVKFDLSGCVGKTVLTIE